MTSIPKRCRWHGKIYDVVRIDENEGKVEVHPYNDPTLGIVRPWIEDVEFIKE